jgi:hypothetical protein
MKLRFLLVGVIAAGLAASAAIAAPPPDKGKPVTAGMPAKGKPSTTGEGCRPKVTVVLKGTVDAASATLLSMDVTGSNRWGRAYVPGTAVTTVGVVESTKVRRNGNTTAADGLATGDRVLVQARVCKADLADGATPELSAARIVAHPAKQVQP